jgi:hypothetical protein
LLRALLLSLSRAALLLFALPPALAIFTLEFRL